MTENERLDKIFEWVSELRGQVAVLHAQMGALRTDIEAMKHPYHLQQPPTQYWLIVGSSMVAAAIIAATIFLLGIPR